MSPYKMNTKLEDQVINQEENAAPQDESVQHSAEVTTDVATEAT